MTRLPSGWEWSTIGEVADVALGRQRSPQHHVGPNMLPYMRSANITWQGIDTSDVKEMNFEKSEAERFELQQGDLLLNEASGSPNEVGKPAVWHGEIARCCFQNTILRVRSRGPLTDYLYWYCRAAALAGRFGEAGRGVNIRHLGKEALSAFPIPVPPLAEQARVVAAIQENFSHLDAAEESLVRAVRRLSVHRQSQTASFMDKQGWAWTTLGAIADLRGGVTKDANLQKDESFVEVPYLRVANVQRGCLDLNDVASIRVSSAKAEALRLEQGDILFNEGGDRDKLGRGWVWEGQIDNCIHQNHVFRARLTSPEFDPYFVSIHANTWGRGWFEQHGRQTTNLASISLTTLKKFPVPVPSRSEQERIVRSLRSAAEARDRLASSLATARGRANLLRQSILAAAFSGQLVRQYPADEPASVLLERIRADRASAPAARRRKAVTS
ncbi:MAG TPA: restriction endonuclease subunit S [Frankiaceae bacterium]|nr:restriction endonuclease subunit S [Frankiaceae bacterium]